MNCQRCGLAVLPAEAVDALRHADVYVCIERLRAAVEGRAEGGK